MRKKSVHLRVHPEFYKKVKNSELSSRDFTYLIAEKMFEEEINNKKKKRDLGGFIV